jgi:hypothetical protein
MKISSNDHIMEFESLLVYVSIFFLNLQRVNTKKFRVPLRRKFISSIQAWNLWNEGKPEDLIDSSIVDSYITDDALLCIHLGLLCTG